MLDWAATGMQLATARRVKTYSLMSRHAGVHDFSKACQWAMESSLLAIAKHLLQGQLSVL